MSKLKESFLGLSIWLMVVFGLGLSFLGEQIAHRVMGFFLIVVLAIGFIIHFKDKSSSANEMMNKRYENDDEKDSSKSEDFDNSIGFVNPASGALMIDGADSVDTFGNSYGSDVSGSFADESKGIE
jgi:hypothetical protein